MCFSSADLDMSIAYWNIILDGRFKFLDIWCEFLLVSSYHFTVVWHRIAKNYCAPHFHLMKYQKGVPYYDWFFKRTGFPQQKNRVSTTLCFKI